MSQATELIAQQYANGAANRKVWSDIIYNVMANGAKGDGVTDDTEAIMDCINEADGVPILFPEGIYAATSIVFESNSHLIFHNAKFKRIGGTGSFITTGENSVLEGKFEIDGNKTAFTPIATLRGLFLSQGSTCYAKVYSHDNAGHGIYMQSNTSIYSPKCINNGSSPGPLGTGDGIYCVNANQVYIENAYCTGNARNNISVTTFDGVSSFDKTLSTDVHIKGAYLSGSGYIGLDAEGIGGGLFEGISGWDSISASSSERCTFMNADCKSFIATHDYIRVKNVKCKPSGSVTNVFLISGKNYYVENVYLFDTASSYGTSNTFDCSDAVNSKGTLINVVVENGYNALVASGVITMQNCDSLNSVNLRMRIDSRRPVTNLRGFEVKGGLSIHTDAAAPTTGTYKVGDRVEFTVPVAAGYLGKVCTAAGTPGTWKGFGLIET